MDENTAAELFLALIFSSLLVLLIATSGKNDKNSLLNRIAIAILNWWDSVTEFPPYDYNAYNNTTYNKGVHGLNYNSWNTPVYKDVWVENYIRKDDGTHELIVAKLDTFVNINNSHVWGWINSKSKYGWTKEAPPPEPSMFISQGAIEDVQAILAAYNGNEIDKSLPKVVEKDTKSTDSTEIDGNKKQNVEIAQ